MNWYKLIKFANVEYGQDKSNRYFAIGHGDFSEEMGFEPSYMVWTWLKGKIEVSDQFSHESNTGGTHGSLWGHHITGKTFKGRYEPETGRVSVVRPFGPYQFRPLPDFIERALKNKFGKDIEVFVF